MCINVARVLLRPVITTPHAMMYSRPTYPYLSFVASAHAAMTLHLKISSLPGARAYRWFLFDDSVYVLISGLPHCSDLTTQQCLDECALKEMCMYAYVEEVSILPWIDPHVASEWDNIAHGYTAKKACNFNISANVWSCASARLRSKTDMPVAHLMWSGRTLSPEYDLCINNNIIIWTYHTCTHTHTLTGARSIGHVTARSPAHKSRLAWATWWRCSRSPSTSSPQRCVCVSVACVVWWCVCERVWSSASHTKITRDDPS